MKVMFYCQHLQGAGHLVVLPAIEGRAAGGEQEVHRQSSLWSAARMGQS